MNSKERILTAIEGSQPDHTPLTTWCFGVAPPAQGEGTDLLLPLLLSGGGAALIVGAVAGARLLFARRR